MTPPERGSAAALSDQLLAHADFAHSLARALIRDPDVAHDVAQESLLIAAREHGRIETSFRSWLAGVVRNVGRMHFRSATRRRRRERESAKPALTDPRDAVWRLELRRQVVDTVLALREPYRSTVILRHFEEMPPREIAASLEVSVETVNTRLKRGHALLREELDRQNDGDRHGWLLALAPLASRRAPASRHPMPSGAIGSRSVIPRLALVAVLVGIGIAVWPDPSGSDSDASDGPPSDSRTASAPSEVGPAIEVGGIPTRAADRSRSDLPVEVEAATETAVASSLSVDVVAALEGYSISNARATIYGGTDGDGMSWAAETEHSKLAVGETRRLDLALFPGPVRQRLQRAEQLRERVELIAKDGVLSGWPVGTLYVVIEAAGYAPLALELESRGVSLPVQVELEPQAMVTIEVPTLPESECYRLALYPRGVSVPLWSAITRGRSLVSGLPTGDYDVWAARTVAAEAPGSDEPMLEAGRARCRAETRAWHTVSLFEGRGAVIEVAVVPPTDVEVTLFDDLRPTPLDQARLFSNNGEYRFSPMPTGRYRVRVSRGGQALAERSIDLVVTEGVHRAVLSVPRGRITGRVFDRNGEPTRGVVVLPDSRGPSRTVEEAERRPEALRIVWSQDDGRYEVLDVPPGPLQLWSASGDSLLSARLSVTGSETRADFDHSSGATRRFELTTERGGAPAAALLLMVGSFGTTAPFAALDATLQGRGPGGMRPTHAYWLPAECSLLLWSYDLSGAMTSLPDWRGDRDREERVALDRAYPVVLEVRIDGQPDREARLTLSPHESEGASAITVPESGALVTDGEGLVTTSPLVPGIYEVRTASGAEGTFTVPASPAGVDGDAPKIAVELRRAGSGTGR